MKKINRLLGFFEKLGTDTRILLLAFVLAGVSFSFVLPPFQAPDEQTHWKIANHRFDHPFDLKASECREFYAWPDHFEISRIAFHADQKLDVLKFSKVNEVAPTCFARPDIYGNLFTYPGVVLARVVASVVGEVGLWGYYLARLLSGFLFLSLLLFFIKVVARTGRLSGVPVLLAFFLLPIAIQQIWTVSSTPIIWAGGMSLLLLVFCVDYLSRKERLLLFAVLLVGILTHPPVIALMIPLLIAVWGKQLFQKYRLYTVVFLFLTCVGVAVALTDRGTRELTPDGVDSALQIKRLVEFPIETGVIIAQTALRYLKISFFPRTSLGWLDTPSTRMMAGVWDLISVLLLLVEVAMIYSLRRISVMRTELSRHSLKSPIASLLWVYLGAFGMASLITVAMFVNHTKVGEDVVTGLQVRYFFLPVVVVLFSLFQFIAKAIGATAPEGDGRLHVVLSTGAGKYQKLFLSYFPAIASVLGIFLGGLTISLLLNRYYH